MKYQQEYRDPIVAEQLAGAIAELVTREWTIMEVCGGQTHSIVRYGIDQLLPDKVTLVHGPGCPVCVTPIEYIDKAIEIAEIPGVIFCSYGDMLRVPGTTSDLLAAKSRGGDVRIVYSPMDAVEIARVNPEHQVVFFAVGFETTAPANAMAVYQACRQQLANFSMLVSHVLVPPALEAILSSATNRVQGFLAAGHVCTIMGWEEYIALAHKYHVPIVVTGFEPVDILQGVYMCLQQLEAGCAKVENQYSRVVQRQGNVTAQNIMREVFTVMHRYWRGIGEIPASGLGLSPAYTAFDAEVRFGPTRRGSVLDSVCISGAILRGDKKPPQCPAFGNRCTPEQAIGVTMVSSEGACAAYYRYRNNPVPETAYE